MKVRTGTVGMTPNYLADRLGGFVQHTGGGCAAIEFQLPAGGWVWVTPQCDSFEWSARDTAINSEELSAGFMVGFYKEDGDFLGAVYSPDIEAVDALMKVLALR